MPKETRHSSSVTCSECSTSLYVHEHAGGHLTPITRLETEQRALLCRFETTACPRIWMSSIPIPHLPASSLPATQPMHMSGPLVFSSEKHPMDGGRLGEQSVQSMRPRSGCEIKGLATWPVIIDSSGLEFDLSEAGHDCWCQPVVNLCSLAMLTSTYGFSARL